MSSTFWMSNRAQREGDASVSPEIDVAETIGAPPERPAWARDWNRRMNANPHYFHRVGERQEDLSAGRQAPLDPPAAEAFHTYGAGWVDPNTIKFYLDDQYQFTLHPMTHHRAAPMVGPGNQAPSPPGAARHEAVPGERGRGSGPFQPAPWGWRSHPVHSQSMKPMMNTRRHCAGIAFVPLALLLTGLAGQAADLQLGKAEPIPKLLYGFNCDLVAATAFQGITFGGPEIENAVCELRPQSLRFPGGTTANNYLWRQDSYSEQTNDLTGWAGEQIRLFRQIGRPYDLPGYARLCRGCNLDPVWVLNVYEETPASVAELLKHLDAIGLDLRAVELGNEPYWDPRSLNDVRRYIGYCQPLVEALRKHKPQLKVGACFAPWLEKPYNYREKWNAVLAQQDWYDAIVFHDYYGGQGISVEPGVSVAGRALLYPEEFIDGSVAALTRLAPGKPIWFTEWNLGVEAIKEWKNKGAELLFVGATFVRLVEHRGAIERAMFHQLYESNFGTFFRNDKSGETITNATYELFRLLGATFAKADDLFPVKFSGDALLGFATRGAGGFRLFVINRGDTAENIQLPAEFSGVFHQRTLDCPPAAVLPGAPSLARTQEVNGTSVTFPPYSISLIASPPALAKPQFPGTAANRFPARPFFTLWYPPYAAQQPRVDSFGRYTLDFAQLKDKPMAVVKMDLQGLSLQARHTYALSFDVAATAGDSMVVHLPESVAAAATDEAHGKPRSEWTPLAETPRRLRFVFRYDPNINEGEVSFFFDPHTVSRGGRCEFQNFKFVSLEDQI